MPMAAICISTYVAPPPATVEMRAQRRDASTTKGREHDGETRAQAMVGCLRRLSWGGGSDSDEANSMGMISRFGTRTVQNQPLLRRRRETIRPFSIN